jgi:hypothetical protein
LGHNKIQKRGPPFLGRAAALVGMGKGDPHLQQQQQQVRKLVRGKVII